MMLLNMPEIVFNRWEKDYQSTTWEKMALNTTTASSKAWEPKHQDKDAKGPWKAVFTNSEESIALTQEVMLSQYYQKVNPKEASVYDCDQARPKKKSTLIPCPCAHERSMDFFDLRSHRSLAKLELTAQWIYSRTVRSMRIWTP